MLVLISLSSCASYHPLALLRGRVEQRLRMPAEKALRIEAAKIHHPLLARVPLNLANGVGPDQAAVLAVILNPTLRANRDRRGLASAQLIQAGILPNPTISYGRDFVAGGNTKGTVAAYGFTGSWDIQELSVVAQKSTLREPTCKLSISTLHGPNGKWPRQQS